MHKFHSDDLKKSIRIIVGASICIVAVVIGVLGSIISGRNDILNLILNTLFASVPEEVYVVTATLILLYLVKVFEKPMCFELKKMLIPILIPAIISNALKYVFLIEKDVVFLIFIPAVFLPLIIIYDLKSIKKLSLSFCMVILTICLNMFLESIYYVFILSPFGVHISDTNPPMSNALLALPLRALEICFIMIIYRKIREWTHVSFFSVFRNDAKQAISFGVNCLFTICYCVAFAKVFAENKLLDKVSDNIVLNIIILVVFALVPIKIMYSKIRYIFDQESNRILAQEKIKSAGIMAKYYASKEKYDNIDDIIL